MTKELDLPPQPPPQPQIQQRSQRQSKSEPSQGTSVARRTRSSQRVEDPLRTDDFTLPILTPDEQKLRENNLSHMTHLKEAMKIGSEKWDEELKKKNDIVRQAWIGSQKETLDGWLQDIDTVLLFAETEPIYVPTVKLQWQRPVQLKLSTTLGDPGT